MREAERVVVLGANGFIGKHIVEQLRKSKVGVSAPSRSDIDLEREGCVARLAKNLLPGCAVVLAAAIPRSRGDTLSLLRRNLSILENLAEAIIAAEPAHVVFLSSVDVYGREGIRLPINEHSALNPQGYYAVGKLCGEQILACACRDRKTPLTVLRLPGIYGVGDNSERLVPALLTALTTGQVIHIAGDGSQRRDLVYVQDVAEVVKMCLAHRLQGTFNCVTGASHAVREILGMLAKECGAEAKVDYQADQSDPVDLVFTPSAILDALSGFRFTHLRDGLSATVRAWSVK